MRPVGRIYFINGLGLGALVAFLLVVYVANIFGPPPPNINAVVRDLVRAAVPERV